MAIFREFSSSDVVTEKDFVEQLVDILQIDISSSVSRKQYQHWVTGGVGPGVTSSLFQTVFDQDFTLQTANPFFDLTVGMSKNSALVLTGCFVNIDSTSGKYYFTSQSLMMREKINIYEQYAQYLLGDADAEFTTVSGSTSNIIREPLFLSFKRIFTRDRIKRESFAIRLYQTSSQLTGSDASNSKLYTDAGSSTNIESSYGGQVSTIVDSANTNYPVGLFYLDKGIAVIDTQRVFDTGTQITGTIDAVSPSGRVYLSGNLNKLLVSASVDDIVDHIANTRFSSGSLTAIAFMNNTFINRTQFFCTLPADQFNYSSNPTYTDSTGRLNVIDEGQEETQRSFTFVTSIGLYDKDDTMLAVAKLSRPVLKDRQRSPIIRVTLDF
jgi:hypothetical protein